MKTVRNKVNKEQREVRLFYGLVSDGDSVISILAFGLQVDVCNKKLQVNNVFIHYCGPNIIN